MIRKFEGENFQHLLISMHINIQNAVMSLKKKKEVFAITIIMMMMIIIWPNFNQNPAKVLFHDVNVTGLVPH